MLSSAAFVVFLICSVTAAAPPRSFTRFQRVEAEPLPPVPHTVYGPPTQQPEPMQEYGPPKESTTTEAEAEVSLTTTEAAETITETEATTEAQLSELNDASEQGAYYIYHPNGVLQRVVYNTFDNQQKMEYSAKLKYQNVPTIRGPIYTYDPETFEYTRLA
ncbi:unnamed protein product [Brassicogethes aeneus]|uniref:DUF4794 domain-containing protein n=1 Tax=Brassicogethes aeneus TaxID=1431903 RepID=A0A9P0B3D8_BRAAE|nr:unnamed protein product [Brassicogethes aeneus]